MSQDYRSIIYAAVMRAYADGELAITYSNKQTATHMRMRVYAFIKSQRARADASQEFLDAAEEVTISVRDNVMLITRKSKMEGFAAMAQALGQPAQGNRTQEVIPSPAFSNIPDLKHQDAEASFQRLQEKLKASGGAGAATSAGLSPETAEKIRQYRGE